MLQEQSAALARQRRQAARTTSPEGPSGVNPEFLAALPAHLQEEVLAQVGQEIRLNCETAFT